MSNTDLPRVPSREPSIFSPGHWLILIVAVLTICGVAGFHILTKPQAAASAPREKQARH